MGACAGAGAEPQRGSVRAAVTTLTHTRPEQAAFGRHDGRPPLAPSLLSRLGLSTHPISRRAECLDFSGTVQAQPQYLSHLPHRQSLRRHPAASWLLGRRADFPRHASGRTPSIRRVHDAPVHAFTTPVPAFTTAVPAFTMLRSMRSRCRGPCVHEGPRSALPGGRYAGLVAARPLVVKVGDSVFVHGGVLPKHLRYGLDRINDEVHDWLLGNRPECPAIVTSEDGPVLSRNGLSDRDEIGQADPVSGPGELPGRRADVAAREIGQADPV